MAKRLAFLKLMIAPKVYIGLVIEVGGPSNTHWFPSHSLYARDNYPPVVTHSYPQEPLLLRETHHIGQPEPSS